MIEIHDAVAFEAGISKTGGVAVSPGRSGIEKADDELGLGSGE